MKLPGGFDIQQMMEQAKQMQEDMQREMQKIRVTASAGGGVINVAMNGAKELLELKIDPEAVKGGDVEMLQDLIIAAVNEASRKADEAMKGQLGTKLGGMGLPDGLL
jgi:DNA-binding YbaB/EbfC family protein